MRCLHSCQHGDGKDKGMEGMFVKQITATASRWMEKGGKKKRKWGIGNCWRCGMWPLTSAKEEILLSLGTQLAGKGCPFFLKGSTLGPSHNNFPDILKPCNPESSATQSSPYELGSCAAFRWAGLGLVKGLCLVLSRVPGRKETGCEGLRTSTHRGTGPS